MFEIPVRNRCFHRSRAGVHGRADALRAAAGTLRGGSGGHGDPRLYVTGSAVPPCQSPWAGDSWDSPHRRGVERRRPLALFLLYTSFLGTEFDGTRLGRHKDLERLVG